MLVEGLAGGAALAATGLAIARTQRARLYSQLERRVSEIEAQTPVAVGPNISALAPDFANRLIVVPSALPIELHDKLTAEALALTRPERSYIPTHKKGGTIAYETLIAHAPTIVSLYQSPGLRAFVTRVAGIAVVPTPINDQSSLSVLFYNRPGDHIDWHYDHNFYLGRHFTVLLSLINEGHAPGKLSHANLKAKLNGAEATIGTPANSLIMFEGAKVHHKVTPIAEGERRMILSMTFCADPRAHLWQGVARRIKDTAFFGLRALTT